MILCKIVLATILCLVTRRIFGWDLSSQAYFSIYGDITTIEDLFLPDISENIQDDTVTDPEPDSNPDSDPIQDIKQILDDSVQITTIDDIFNTKDDKGVTAIDEKQLRGLDTQAHIITRRKEKRMWDLCISTGYKCYYHYPYDPIQMPNRPTKEEYTIEENRKVEALRNVCLGFLIHTRREVNKALDQRRAIQHDKRYKLGYMFNRIRRLRTEMAKIINSAHAFFVEEYSQFSMRLINTANNLTLLLRAYEQVARFDIDIKDTIKHIKAVGDRPAEFDYNK